MGGFYPPVILLGTKLWSSTRAVNTPAAERESFHPTGFSVVGDRIQYVTQISLKLVIPPTQTSKSHLQSARITISPTKPNFISLIYEVF